MDILNRSAAFDMQYLPRCQWAWAAILISVFLLLAPRHVQAADKVSTIMVAGELPGQADDVALQAAFVLNFLQYVTWPNLQPEAPVTILCASSTDLETFARVLGARSVGGHALRLSPYSPEAAKTAQVAFLREGGRGELRQMLAECASYPILTVSDAAGFAQMGGIVNFYRKSGKLRFEINVDAVSRAGLRISSQLLKLARILHEKEG